MYNNTIIVEYMDGDIRTYKGELVLDKEEESLIQILTEDETITIPYLSIKNVTEEK